MVAPVNKNNLFVWYGRMQDGGFSWFSLPGASMQSADVLSFIQHLSSALFATGHKGHWKEVQHG